MKGRLASNGCCVAITLLVLAPCTPCQAQVSLRIGYPAGEEQHLEQALRERGSLDVVDTPLGEVVTRLGRQFHVPILLSVKRLEEAGIGTDTPVTARIESVSLESLLDLVLSELELDFTVRSGVILVTTPEELEMNLDMRVYPVRDLVLWRVPGADGGKDHFEADYDALIDVITTTVEPETWDDVGGPGSVIEFDKSAAIVVSQTRRVHRQIEQLLATLRKARELQGIASMRPPDSSSQIFAQQAGAIAAARSGAVPAQAWHLPRIHSSE